MVAINTPDENPYAKLNPLGYVGQKAYAKVMEGAVKAAAYRPSWLPSIKAHGPEQKPEEAEQERSEAEPRDFGDIDK
jgi:hypothetical protein